MKVYVDTLMVCLQSKQWPWPKSCHMFIDPNTPDRVLHDFAAKLGLKRSWYQTSSRLPHYDLNASKRRQAVEMGAVECTPREMVAVMREHQSQRKDTP